MEFSHKSQLHSVENNNEVAKWESCDRLSELPDSLILEILSLLETRDAVRTTILSKLWKNRWSTVHCLNFRYGKWKPQSKIQSFINGALAQWKGDKISKFCIDFSCITPRANALQSWLLFAIEKKVEELSLHLGNKYRHADMDYCLPWRLYSCSSITKLSLSYIKMKEDVQWGRLKSLTIDGVNPLCADAMNRILRGAPRLEELFFCTRDINEKFNIRSTSLKTLFIASQIHKPDIVYMLFRSELNIWAPNLLTLEIHARFYGTCSLDVPSLTNGLLRFHNHPFEIDLLSFSCKEMFNQVFQSICHVENVMLSNWCSKFLIYMIKNNWKEDHMVVQFPNAKFLDLYLDEPVHEILDVLEMFPKLINLSIKHQGPNIAFCQRENIQIGYSIASKTTPFLHHLKTIEISWPMRNKSVFPMTQIVLENAHVLKKMVLRLDLYGCDQENCQTMFDFAKETVMSMPRSSPTVELFVVKTCHHFHCLINSRNLL